MDHVPSWKSFSTYLIFSLHIQHVFHIELERVGASRPDDTGPLVDFEPPSSPVPHDEVVDVVVGVRVPRLESEDWGIGCSVQLDHGLHGQWPVDEVGGLVVDIFDVDDHALVVRV